MGKALHRREKVVKTAPAKIRLLKEAANPWYEVTLIEGRNRQIRRMFEQVGHHVEKIKRVRYGPLELDVETGKFRPLTVAEVGRLKAAVRQRIPASGKAPNEGTPRRPKSGRTGDTGQAAR
jgi:23S rRNA pseudouridine2605 synthase